MKRKLLRRMALLLLGMMIGAGSVSAQSANWSYTVNSGDASKLNTTDETFTVDDNHVWSYGGTTVASGSPGVTIGTANSTSGIKFGSSGTVYYSPVILSTNAFSDKAITKVSLYLKHNGSKAGLLTVKQGEVTIGTATTTNTSSWITVTCSETNRGEGGALTIKYEVAQALYINKIEVWYEDLVSDSPLSSIVVDASNAQTTFSQGDTFTHDGVTVTASYENSSTRNVTSLASFSDPDMTTTGNKTVTVSYTEGGVTKTASYQITVTEQLTEFDIALNNSLFETNYTGTVSGITDDNPVSGTLNNVTVTYAGSGNHYINNSQIRFYPSNKLTFEAPEGYNIKQIIFTSGGTWGATISADRGTYTTDTKKWTGLASSVMFTGGGSSRCDMSKAAIILEEVSPLSSIALSGNYPTSFNVGDEFSYDGLIVTATYESGNTKDVTADAVVSTPDMTTTGTKTVTVTYTFNSITETATYDITVHEYQQPTQVTVNNLGYSFWGLTPEGSATYCQPDVAQSERTYNGVTFTAATNTGTKVRFDETHMRLYNHNTLTINAPSGYVITNITLVGTSTSYWSDGMIADVGTYNDELDSDKKTYWTGAANSVTFTPGGTHRIASAIVTLAIPVTVTSAEWATFAPTQNVSFDSQVMSAYVVTNATTTSATLQEVTSVPANTPVLICAEPGTYALTVVETATAPTTNLLQVSTGSTTGNGSTIYSLAQIEGEVGFYLVGNGVTIPAGKCYLNIQGTQGGTVGARAFLSLGDNSETGITTVAADAADGNIYDLTGRRVSGVARGLYIVNGKKVVLK